MALFARVLTALALSGGISSAPAQSSGFTPEWEIRKTVSALSVQCQRLKPILEQVRPQEWISKGAPQAYVTQYNSTRTELAHMAISTENLAREPEKLTFAMDTFFRVQTFDSLLASLAEGVRKYQNPALADLLRGVMSESSSNREKLRQYLLELASAKEQEFQVVSQEAQRCRGLISRQPPPLPKSERKAEHK